ncbi:class II glutamine amidotransferase [Propionivibrio sp.]|uniref:class II glutamine amidotransferase n=1 Tax=Propionivibrio sp. TaxID=2212460 RepID=UPI0039E6BA47
MCQLLALNSNHPAAITFSFEGFVARGGLTGKHRDGWGIAFFEDTGCRLFIDYQASIDSPIAQLIKHYPIKSTNIVAHVRLATQGKVSLPNCHPFMRELWGKYWVFAHNGDLKDFHPALNGQYLPVGFTDSEAAFCFILQGLRERHPYREPPLDVLFRSIREIATGIAAHGTFNFLLSNGDFMFAHCSTDLFWVQRGYPFSTAKLVNCDVSIDFSHYNKPNDLITVIATQPLTCDEQWNRFERGELLTFFNGEIVRRYTPEPPAAIPEGSEKTAGSLAC